MAIRVYNTLTRQKEELKSDGERIGIYVCGVTPYSDTHLGHARPSVVWDVIKKYLHIGVIKPIMCRTLPILMIKLSTALKKQVLML